MKHWTVETQLKMTAWPLLIGALVLHAWIAFMLEFKWFQNSLGFDFWVSFAFVLILVVMADRFIPLALASYYRRLLFMSIAFALTGAGALYIQGAIMLDISKQNRQEKIEDVVRADSIYTPMADSALASMNRYSKLEIEKSTSFRSSFEGAQKRFAYADSARYANANAKVSYSVNSQIFFYVVQVFFLLLHLYSTHLFKLAGAYVKRDTEKPKPAKTEMPTLAKFSSGKRRRSRARVSAPIQNDAGQKTERSQAFYKAMREMIAAKANGSYKEGDGRRGTDDVSTAAELIRIHGVPAGRDQTKIYREAKYSAEQLIAKFPGLAKTTNNQEQTNGKPSFALNGLQNGHSEE